MYEKHNSAARPMVLVALSYWAGVLIVANHWVSSLWLLLLASGVTVALWIGLPRIRRYANLPLALVFIFAGALSWTARHSGPEGDSLQRYAIAHAEDTLYVLHGTVIHPGVLLPDDEYMQFQLRISSIIVDGRRIPIDGGVLARWTKPDRPLVHGEGVFVQGKILPTIHRVNHGVTGIEDYYRANNIHSSIRLLGPNAVVQEYPSPMWSMRGFASRARQDLAERLVRTVPDYSLPFVLTVWLGDRQRMEDEPYRAFVESGTAHILAVSGVHVGIIYITLAYGLRLGTKNNRYRILITLLAVALFAFVAGARVSSLRAALMVALYLSAEWFEREPDAPTALGLAALLFGIENPDIGFTAGFQLSFLSIASLLMFRLPISERLSALPRFLREGVSSVLAVQILPIPAAILTFHVVAPGGLIANLLVIPLLSIVLWLSIATSILSYVATPLAVWFGYATSPVVWCISTVAEQTAAVSWSHAYLPSPTPLALLGYGATVTGIAWWLYGSRRWKHAAAMVAIGLISSVLFWKPWRPDANVTFLDVGHGDAAVVHTEDNKIILIDTGNLSDYVDMGEYIVAPYLWSHHVSRIDALFISHTDRDHLGGAYHLLQRFPVGVVYVPPGFSDNEEGKAFLVACEASNSPVQMLASGNVIEVGQSSVTVLHPTRDGTEYLDDNDRSLVFVLESGGIRTLFTGDIETKAESMIFEDAQLDVDVIKVPHHGSRTSSSDIFLDAIKATVAVVSSGMRGDKALARPEVIARYDDRGMSTYRTDYGGSIRIKRVDGELHISEARTLRKFAIR